MLGTACFFNWFLVKKSVKREISGQFSVKAPYKRTTIFPKRNGFLQRRTYALGFQNKVADSTRTPEKKVADSSRIPGKKVAGILLTPLGLRDSGFPGF